MNLSITRSHQQWLQYLPKSCSEALPDQHRHCSPSFAFQYTLPKTLTAAAHPALRRMSKHRPLALDARANLRLKCSIAALCPGNVRSAAALRVSEWRDKPSRKIAPAPWILYIILAEMSNACFSKGHDRMDLEQRSIFCIKKNPWTDIFVRFGNWILFIHLLFAK